MCFKIYLLILFMTLPNEKLTFDCFQIFQLQCCLQLLFVGWTCHSVSVAFGRQLCGVESLLPPVRGSRGLKLGFQIHVASSSTHYTFPVNHVLRS